MIFGSMKDKNVAEIARILFPKAQTLILTKPENSRAMPAEQIADLVPPDIGRDRIIITGTAAEALEIARNTDQGDAVILVTGSLYLVGEIQRLLKG
jgi:dihydrofolate synthase / folylpolyglutamate synthase